MNFIFPWLVEILGRLFKQSLDNVYESLRVTHVKTMSADYLNVVSPLITVLRQYLNTD